MIRLELDQERLEFDMEQAIIDIVQLESMESCKRLNTAFGFYGDDWQSARVGRSTTPIHIKIFTRNVRAFITEFGYGSLMAGSDQNPFLNKYINNSIIFNQERRSKNMAILRRGKDPFTTLNWEGGENAIYLNKLGGSEPKGQNLEGKTIGLYSRGGITVTPKVGKFIFKKELVFFKQQVIDHLQRYFRDEFNMSKYIMGGD